MCRGYIEPALFTQENNDLAAERDGLTAEKERLTKEVSGNVQMTKALDDLLIELA